MVTNKKEKNIEKYVEDIQKTFFKYKLSGIIFIPEYGSLSLFYDETGKLHVLDQAQIELMVNEKLHETISNNWIMNKVGKEKARRELFKIKNDEKEDVKYIG